jgi:hypothetical protein
MTEPRRRTAWSALADEWDPNHPAIRRMQDALALQPVQEAPQRPEPAEVESEPTPEPAAVPESSRRQRIQDLIQRSRNGDLSATDILRRLLDSDLRK